MVGKKGFIRTLEAVIAILLILGLIYFITPAPVEFEEKIPSDLKGSQEYVVKELLQNKFFRECVIRTTIDGSCKSVLPSGCESLLVMIEENLPGYYDYACEICSRSASCLADGVLPLDRSVYTTTVFLSSEDTLREAKILRLYFWRKG